MVLISFAPKGTFDSVIVLLNKIDEAIKGKTAFFAPLHIIVPLTPFVEEPLIKNFSINYFDLASVMPRWS